MEGQLQKLSNARQRSQAETRGRLLKAATKLFAEKGCSNTTTGALASEAGVAVGTVYLHFKDKDALLNAVLKSALARLKQELGKTTPNKQDGHSLVQEKMLGLANYTQSFSDLAAVLFDGGNLSTIPGKEALDILIKSQENGLMVGISDGYYRGDLHSGLAARAQVGVLVQILGWWAKNPQAVDKAEVVEVLTELRLNGLKR
ncbi:MAG: TetR/AcrR family transcriptional regulator [Gemmatimonadales bacterium]|nr:TetR/AcrR family transcriptional regulator [Gemmatimonadales bacterium]